MEVYRRFEKEGVKQERVTMNTNKIAQFLEKPPEEFTKQDLIKFIEAKNIEMLNFRYVGGDGRLKTLNFVIASKAQLDSLAMSSSVVGRCSPVSRSRTSRATVPVPK